MKYGLVYNKNARNIGDDIQSFAIAQHLPSIDYMVSREEMDVFKSKNKEQVAVIMAAWFMFHKANWPPADNIIPQFTGFHYTDRMFGFKGSPDQEYRFLEGIGGDYMRRAAPIGCRDYYTKEVMDQYNIPSYFSGCITLTLPQMPIKKSEKPYICLVDVESKEVIAAVEDQLKDTNIEIRAYTHQNKEPYPTGTPWETRAAAVQERLTIYQNAHCVITRRLHCSLPCLAMGVPVLLVDKDRQGHRFKPYYDWLHSTTPQEAKEGKLDYSFVNPPPNDTKHIVYREQITADIKAFIKSVEDPEKIEKVFKPAPYTRQQFESWRIRVMRKTLIQWGSDRRLDIKEKKAIKKELDEKKHIIEMLMKKD